MNGPAVFERITIIGLGLIGSSIARAARAKGLADIIVGCDMNDLSLAFGRSHGFIDVAISDPATAVKESQLVILATPPSTFGPLAATIAPHLPPGAIVMDTGSVKQSAIADIAPHIPNGIDFVPAHPIAGSEQSGVAHGKPDLFAQRLVVLTPVTLPKSRALQLITSFWTGMGAKVEGLPPALHDLVYAHVSHLPQLLAFAARPFYLNNTSHDANLLKFLRLGNSSPKLWGAIFSANKEEIVPALDEYLNAVSHIASELETAPEEDKSDSDNTACDVLFPRIAASCLITTVMQAERHAGFPFGRYSGTGFADFTALAAVPPESDIERISSQSSAVAALLRDYIGRLTGWRELIAAGDSSGLFRQLTA